MLSSKADVDRHVAKALAKLKTTREKNFRSYSIARLYFDVDDYETCINYVTQYLSVKDNNAAAHNLLGQAYKKLGQKEEALAAFKTSLELDPNQNNLILKVCELLADDSITTDVGCIRFWVDRASAAFPRHPTVFQLTQRLLRLDHADSATICNLLQERVEACPTNPSSHARFLRQLIECTRITEAFNRAFDIQVTNAVEFRDSLLWQDVLLEVVNAYKNEAMKKTGSDVWNYWFLRLTAIDRKVFLKLEWKHSPADVVEALRNFDRALSDVAQCQKLESPNDLLTHFRGQFCLYAGSLLFKKALHDKCGWRELTRLAVPLFLIAIQTDSTTTNKISSLTWPAVAAFRTSQAGHTLLACVRNRKQLFLDCVKQLCSEQLWRDKIYKELFNSKDKKIQIGSSFMLNAKWFAEPKIKLPNVQELLQIDLSARLFLVDSLHHQVWIGMNFDKMSKLASLDFDESKNAIDSLPNCGPETLTKLDMDAFLYCAVLIAQQNLKGSKKRDIYVSDQPSIIPAMLVEPLCNSEQAKWWEYAVRISRCEEGSQNPDTRQILTRGIETIRCTADHGLDPYLLAMLGRTFAQRVEGESEKKRLLAKRAMLYYSAALPLLERLRDHTSINPPKKRLFNFTYQDFNTDFINSLLDETKLFLGKHYMDENDNERALEILTGVISPYASFYLYKIYMNLADEQVNLKKENITSEMRTKRFTLLSKARHFIYLTSDRLKDSNAGQDHPLSDVLSEYIENIEALLSSVEFETNVSKNISEDSSEELSYVGELGHQMNSTPERNPATVQNLNTSRSLEAQIRQLQINYLAPTSNKLNYMVDTNKLLRDQVQQFKSSLEEMKSYNLDSGDKRRFLSSIDDIRCKIEELRDENMTNMTDLKKEISELRRDLEKLKLPSQRREEDLYLLEESYRANTAQMPYLPRVPGAAPPQMYPQMYPPNLYQLYSGVPPMFHSQLFPSEQSMYQDLLLPSAQIAPPQVPPPQIIPPKLVPPQIIPPPIVPPPQSIVTPQAHTLASTSQAAPITQTVPINTNTAAVKPTTAIHDYHITLPAQSQTMPSIVATQTSTPVKPLFDIFQTNNSATKPFSFFDKINTSIGESPKTTIDTHVANVSANKSLNKSRTMSEKSNESIDPYPEYRPVVPLPDEITPVTGEEDETAIFDSRAKLFRFISGEWKERGLGQLKLLKSNSTGKVRLLMRRDTVHTVCANHIITPEIEISLMKGTDKAYFWVANDFADDTVTLEKFCVRFKTVEIGKKFCDIFNSSKQLNGDIKNSDAPTDNTVKEKTIFNKSWKCPECFTLNDESANKCDICEAANPNNVTDKPPISTPLGGFMFSKTPTFKIVSNAPAVSEAVVETTKANPFGSFTFNKPAGLTVTAVKAVEPKTTPKESTVVTTPVVSGWGDKFKPKAGSWSCNSCYMNNDASNNYCVACESPKEPGMPEKEKKPDATSTKFKFGIPAAGANNPPPSATFQFGINNQNTVIKTTGFTLTPISTPPTTKTETIATPEKPATFVIGSGENAKYDFVFTPKTTVGKSPNKTSEDCANDNEYAQEDEGHHIIFEPVIPLPEKVEVKTGEEDETVLYSHRAKLFRFADSEWKECGVGDVKILQHNENKKIRVVMRREPILKICLNHALTEDIEYLVKDQKSWLFSACDFSTGEICAQQFCIRFVNADVAIGFLDAINEAKKLLTDDAPNNKTETKQDKQENKVPTEVTSVNNKIKLDVSNNLNSNDDVEFVSESSVSNKELALARKLKLPDKFFAYKELPACPGCRGCKEDDDDDAEAVVQIKNNEFPKAENVINFSMKDPSYNVFGGWNTNAINKSGTFDFSGFSMAKPPATSIFGGSPNAPPATAPSIFPNANKMSIFGSTPTTTSTTGFVFGSKPIFSDSKCVLFDNKSVFPNVTPAAVPTTQASIFGGASEPPSIAFNAANTQPKKFEGFSFGALKEAITQNKDANELKSPDKKNDSDLYADEENKEIFFKPIIPLPDEVEVVTGEENEEVLYCHRAKLLRFANSEWKECGVGDVKILLNPVANKLRVLMRREPIMKLCLNHALTCEMEYIKKDEKSWLFSANDFSTEKITAENFCLRFVNGDVATEFRNAIDRALKFVSDDTERSYSSENKYDDEQDSESIDNNISNNSKGSFRGLAPPKFQYSTVEKPSAPPATVTTKDNTVIVNKFEPVFGAKSFNFMNKDASHDNKDNKENSATDFTLTNNGEQNKNITPIFLKDKLPQFPSDKFFNSDNSGKSISANFVIGEKFNTDTPNSNEDNYFSLASKSLLKQTNEENKTTEAKPFTWSEAGTPLFQSPGRTNEASDEYDPHYNAIVPLPEKIDVVTGEEDEIVEFQKRAKLYRWSNGEWKERGTGQIKILHHPGHGTYRLLLRQDLVHKVVLNQLITAELELLPINNCPKSFMWMCINYTDDEQGALEKLAMRFGKEEFAKQFKENIESIKTKIPAQGSEHVGDNINLEKSEENDDEENDDDEDDEDYYEKDNDNYYDNS